MQTKIGEHQCGFIRGGSTVDVIYTVKQIIETVNEHVIGVKLLFVDFKQRFDIINREHTTGASSKEQTNKTSKNGTKENLGKHKNLSRRS